MFIGGRHWCSWVCILLFFFFLFCSVSEAALGVGRRGVEIIHMDSVTDLSLSMCFVSLAYLMQYLGMGGVFELTNPKGFNSKSLSPKEAARRYKQVRHEIKLGMSAMVVTVAETMAWLYFIDPYTPFHGFFENRDYNIWWFLGSIPAYVWWFDTWFYWSHRWLHDFDFLWNNVHYLHHQFKEPSCFAQFAVHPIEAMLQGPIGHFSATLFFPFHPVTISIFGFLGSLWAIAAHDGRQFDFNHHYYHHSKGRGRFIYFNLGFITPFWDSLCGTRWSEDHPMWVTWKTKQGKEVYDTRDGLKSGVSNDLHQAYK